MSEAGESLKFKLRRERVRQLEREQEAEDLRDLAMTPAQYALLRKTFESVKTEFADLDGLSWECESARQILRNWEHKRAIMASITRRRNEETHTLKRSVSSVGSTFAMLPPVSMVRTRKPLVSFSVLERTSPATPPRGPRIASVLLKRDDGSRRTLRGDTWDDTTISPTRHHSASLSDPRAAGGDDACRTVGRSFGKGAKTRSALPSAFLAPCPSDLPTPTPTKSAFVEYIESNGQNLEPLASVLTEPELDDASADSCLGVTNVLGDLGTQIDETTSPRSDQPSQPHADLARRVPPPILAGSPRLGGAANTLWGVPSVGSRMGSPRIGSSPRVASVGRRSGVMGPSCSPYPVFDNMVILV